MNLTIKKSHLDALHEYLEKINRKAVKLSQPLMSVEVVREYTQKYRNPLGIDGTLYLVDIILHGGEPQIKGWGLAGILEFTEGGTLVRGVPGIELPARFRQATNHCDHCRTTRRRAKVIILRNLDKGDFIQVGSTCVADFLGMTTVESYLAWLNITAQIGGDLEDLEVGGGEISRYVERSFSIDEFVGAASIIIRRFGWVPKSKAFNEHDATANQTWELLRPADGPAAAHSKQKWIDENELFVVERDNRRAAAAIKWIENIDADNDYLHNLQVIVKKRYVIYREAGFAASLLAAYEKAMDLIEKRKQQPVSQHLGTVSQRYRFNLTVRAMRSFDGDYGVRTMVRFEDQGGNVLIWWAAGEPEWLETGDTVTVAGTVKKHDEYKGVKQTLLNRVSRNLPEKLETIGRKQ